MPTIHDLRAQRVQSKITGALLCQKAGISRSRLSDIERGVAEPRPEEQARLNGALVELREARQKLERIAAECGWPGLV
jgi:predicted transcriptional regulator